jgi:hypothetical protein
MLLAAALAKLEKVVEAQLVLRTLVQLALLILVLQQEVIEVLL